MADFARLAVAYVRRRRRDVWSLSRGFLRSGAGGGGGGSPYIPALKFNDARNSMYL